jgi:hypothetical protein
VNPCPISFSWVLAKPQRPKGTQRIEGLVSKDSSRARLLLFCETKPISLRFLRGRLLHFREPGLLRNKANFELGCCGAVAAEPGRPAALLRNKANFAAASCGHGSFNFPGAGPYCGTKPISNWGAAARSPESRDVLLLSYETKPISLRLPAVTGPSIFREPGRTAERSQFRTGVLRRPSCDERGGQVVKELVAVGIRGDVPVLAPGLAPVVTDGRRRPAARCLQDVDFVDRCVVKALVIPQGRGSARPQRGMKLGAARLKWATDGHGFTRMGSMRAANGLSC